MIPDKRALRSDLRARRAAAPAAVIAVPAAFLDRLTAGLTVASYVPLKDEADPSPLARAAVEAGCIVVLPHVVDRAIPLRFLAWDTEAALAAGPFGLHQPAADAAEHIPDIVLTPLLGFDRRGNRLGQGAGHYDRAFAACPDAWRVGIALSVQEIESIAVDPWDMPLHAIATDASGSCPKEPNHDAKLAQTRGRARLCALIAVWCVLVTSLSGIVGGWHWVFQLMFYLITGIIWIAPLKPMLRWMETGSWR